MSVSQAKRWTSTVRHRIGRSGMLLIIVVIAWYLWVVISGVTSQYDLELTSPYLVAPIVLALGIAVGGLLRRQWRRGKVLPLVLLVLVVTLVSLPIYANASAAVGGLFIALIGLGVLELRESMPPNRSLSVSRWAPATEERALRQAIVLPFILGVGLLLVLDSQAAIVLTGPVALVIAYTTWRLNGPPQWVAVLLGFLIAAGATLTVVFLGSRATWPAWLSASQSLSGARHTLWSDALSLWATAPFFGSGPGAFTPSSELATSTPSLAAVHSLPLQVGSELGIVGVTILAALFIGGLSFAARGNRPVALLAITAWTALAVHSSIDHLEDFPVVALMAGVILGWAGAGERFVDEPRGSQDDWAATKPE